ncbi:MAG: hypothetical protein U9O41_08700 [Candidatus Aerophobetes bacterium]|nr:hypothetical protein [Candidatus Aerophobetes bacterium]
MKEESRRLILEDPHCHKIVKVVLSNPYIERHSLVELTGLSKVDFDEALKNLQELMLVFELASQADSSVESRVPKKIYLLNPDFETEVKELLQG